MLTRSGSRGSDSLPTLFMASAILAPISVWPFDEIVPTCAIFSVGRNLLGLRLQLFDDGCNRLVKHAEVAALFAQWRQDDTQPVGSVHCQLPANGASNFVPLTPGLLRRLSDGHYVYENDFQWRGALWAYVKKSARATD